ncbi:hypothetical protein LTR22_027741, partial [Elasticomyces elasticus]
MAIKDEEPPFTMGMLGVFMEMVDPLGPNLICGPAIVTDTNPLGFWKASWVPSGL